MDRPLVIYHGNCADGFTAAWVMARAMKRKGIEVDLHPGVYGEPAPDVRGREVWLLDFSYPKAVVEDMARVAAVINILDHHETAWKQWGIMADGDRFQQTQPTPDNLYLTFHKELSGAGIAWKRFYDTPARKISDIVTIPVADRIDLGMEAVLLGMEAVLLVEYVQDRDLWKFELPNSRAINAWIFSYEYTLENWDRMAAALNNHSAYGNAVSQGEAIERKHFKDIKEFLALATGSIALGGVRVPCANVPYHWGSDAGHILAAGHSFAVTYYDRGDGKRVYGLRSEDTGANVGEIAKRYGGGGHAHAAGFEIPKGMSPDTYRELGKK